MPQDLETGDIGGTENLCVKMFKVGEPFHGGIPTLLAIDVGFQWYGKASQLENILGSKNLGCNDLNMRKMAQICGKRHKFVGNGLDMWKIAKICDKWLSCVGNGLNMWEMA